MIALVFSLFFFFNDPAPTEIYTLSLHDALPISFGHDPNHAGAYAQLATMLRGKLPDADLDAMRQILANPLLADGKRSVLHFGLAQVLDAKGAFDEAAAHLERANGLSLATWRKRRQSYDP